MAFAGTLLLSSSQARAAGDDDGKSKEWAARKACLAGDPAKGVELLAELFIDTRDATHIYNQARCFEQNHRYEDAISRYREFLKKSQDLSENDRADVQKQIAECQRYLQPGTVATPPTSATATPVADVTQSRPAATETQDGRGLRIAGIASGAVGLVAIGTAIYFYARAASLSDKITASKNSSASDFAAGKSAETMQWVFYSVGGAALATGAVLSYLGWRAAILGQTSVMPIAGPGLAGIAAEGAF